MVLARLFTCGFFLQKIHEASYKGLLFVCMLLGQRLDYSIKLQMWCFRWCFYWIVLVMSPRGTFFFGSNGIGLCDVKFKTLNWQIAQSYINCISKFYY